MRSEEYLALMAAIGEARRVIVKSKYQTQDELVTAAGSIARLLAELLDLPVRVGNQNAPR